MECEPVREKMSSKGSCASGFIAICRPRAKSLHISVRVIEWYALNTQRANRSLGIPLRDRNRVKFLPVSLRQNKPAGLINKAGKCVFLV